MPQPSSLDDHLRHPLLVADAADFARFHSAILRTDFGRRNKVLVMHEPVLARREVFVPARPEVVGDGAEHRITAIASTDDLDRYGSIVEPGGMRAPRGPVPLLAYHDGTRVVGIVERIDRRQHEIVIEATIIDEPTWELVRSGALSGVSIGFLAHQVDATDPPRIVEWELIEISLVSTPANANAVVTEVRAMPDSTTTTASAGAESGALVPPATLPARVIRDIPAAGGPFLRGGRRAAPRFSLSTVLTATVEGVTVPGFEGEVVTELQRRSDVPSRGVRVPSALFQRRDISTRPGSAAALSPDEYLQDLLDDVSSARRFGTLSNRLGFVVISSIREQIHVPKRLTVSEADFIVKDDEAPETEQTFDADIHSPRYVAVTTRIARSALRYSDPAIDVITTRDIGAALDDRIDHAALFGTGAGNYPRGLLLDPPDPLTVDLAGDSVQAGHLFSLKQAMMRAWRLDGETGLRWTCNQALYDKFRVTSRKPLGGDGAMEWFSGIAPFNEAEGTLVSVPVVQSGRHLEKTAGEATYDLFLIYGGMALLVYFGGNSTDLLIDPYSESIRGRVRITAFVDFNVLKRDPNVIAVLQNADAKVTLPDAAARAAAAR